MSEFDLSVTDFSMFMCANGRTTIPRDKATSAICKFYIVKHDTDEQKLNKHKMAV